MAKVTTEILWKGALIFAVIDIFFVSFLVWKISNNLFYRFKWPLLVITSLFWCLIWLCMSSFFWESVYHFVFPQWARWIIPPFYGVMFGLISLFFWKLALYLPGKSVLNFLILGGLLGAITHIWAISRGILDNPPILQGASPIAASVLPIFEFTFYWCTIVSISFIISKRFRNGLEK